MFVCTEVLEDGVLKKFCFDDESQFNNFAKFVWSYIFESGASSGKNAYWVLEDIYVERVRKIPKKAKLTLRMELIKNMAKKIITERLAGQVSFKTKISIGTINGAIAFKISRLPKRQMPKPGDMFRIIEPLYMRGYFPTQGKVLRELKNCFEIIGVADIKPSGKIRPVPIIYSVRKECVMKVFDWTQYLREL